MCERTEETLTVKEIQEILKIGTNSAYALVRSNVFPVRKVGHSYRVPRGPFYAWLNLQTSVAAVP